MFDQKCYQLASDFLSDEPKLDNVENRGTLAQEIQDCIEDWIRGEKDED